MKNNTKKILIGAIVLAACAAGGFAWYRWQENQKAEQARLEAAKAESLQEMEASIGMTFVKNSDGNEITEFEYGSVPVFTKSFVESHTGSLHCDTGLIDTMKPGETTVTWTLSMRDQYDQTVERTETRVYTVRDTKSPEIVLSYEDLYLSEGDEFDPYWNIESVSDPVDGDLAPAETLERKTYTVTDETDPDTPGYYTVTVTAMDKNGNTSEASYGVTVSEKQQMPAVAAGYPYFVRVNRAANTVTVYAVNDDGTIGDPVRAMVCSTGLNWATPLGTYQTFKKQEWNWLFGNVWGQYSTGIVGDILFHSVPYYTQDKGDLEYDEYNKLGSFASMGCVRMAVADVKWLYDNCPIGTTVEIYDDAEDPGPLGKPSSIWIDTSDSRRGWDPTDPDPDNPW